MTGGRLWIALAITLAGALLAHLVQTGFGKVSVREVQFANADGSTVSGLLYQPETATADSPAPGILAVHGYINTRETQSGFAIEFARRGFVVLAIDQSGHGDSDPPAFASGFGAPVALAFLRGLPFVDPARIGLEGHSMGGWAVQVAAANAPDSYAAMVLQGSSTGTFGAPEGTPNAPKNLLLVFSRYDEFSELMWGAPVPRDIVGTEKLRRLFGTVEPVEIGREYGNVDAGTARKLLMPAVTHPGDHHSREAIGAAVDWMVRTLSPDSEPARGQTWYWKELGTLIALVGLVLTLLAVIDRLYRAPRFSAMARPLPQPVQWTHRRATANVALASLLPVATYFPLQALGNVVLPANLLFPQQITNGVLVWAWGTGLVSLAAFAAWRRGAGRSLSSLGLPLDGALVRSSMLLAALAVAAVYLLVVAAHFLLLVDFRVWVVALRRPSPDQAGMFVIYLPFFTAFFVLLSLVLHTQVPRAASATRDMLQSGAVAAAGFVLLLLAQYLPFFAGGTMLLASQPLLTIVAFQFVAVLFVAGVISAFCFHRTGHLWTGAFVNSLLVTWYLVAGTATQSVPFWS